MLGRIFDFLVYTEKGDEVSYYPTAAGNIVLFLVIVFIFTAMAVFCGYKAKTRVKQLAFSAMAVTLAVVTSMFPLFKFPFGGSITLFSMFFICYIGYLYGTKAGILTGISYGFIQLLLEPYVIHPVQLFLDYPIAFGCLGLAGVFANKRYGILKGYMLGVFGRYICSVLSGCIFFSSYAPEGMNPVLYSLGYNVGYMGPEVVITVILIMIPQVSYAFLQIKKMAIQN